MRWLLVITTILGFTHFGESFTKYGRTCKDIGCPSTQQCVMETDPCSYQQRQGECGAYPTCKRISSGTSRTCSTFVCPPSQVCKMDGDTPKCVNDASKSGHVGYDTQSAAGSLDPNAPPANGGGNLYPSIPRGETTARPNIGYQPAGGGAGYQGGQIGSGYPGQAGGNTQGGGYPQQGGYPQGGYPQGGYQGYPQGGYQQGGYQQGGYQQGGYPQGGYAQGGYNQGGSAQYPNGYQNGYNPYQQQYPKKSDGNSLSDKITSGLKTIGLFYILVSYYLARTFQL